MTINQLPALPAEIFVLGMRFRIESVANVDDGDAIGDMTGFYRRIRVDNTLTLARQWRVLWHELIHSCIHVVGADAVLDDSINEILTTSLEHGLEQVLRQYGTEFVAAVRADEEVP